MRLAAALALVLLGLVPSSAAAHDTGDGGAHHAQRPLRFKLVRFPRPRPTPDFTLADLNGRPVRSADLKGKVVLLNFWATWCPPCVREMPSMEKLHRRFQGRPFEVIAVSMDQGGVEAVRDFVEKGKLTFRILLDPEKKTEYAFAVRGLPISYVIDHRGRMIAGAIGAQDWASKKAIAFFRPLVQQAETE